MDTENKITYEDSVTVEENGLELNRCMLKETPSTPNNMRMTSTPIPRTQSKSSKTSLGTTHNSQQATGSDTQFISRSSTQSADTSKKMLLIGDSLITGINKKGLKENIYKHAISGASTDTLLAEIEVYNLHIFSHILIYVGGNNASDKTDKEYFEDRYDQLICHIEEHNKDCKIVLINSFPRRDADVSEVNDIISSLSNEHQIELADVNSAFFNKQKELIQNYYDGDKIHLSASGIKRLVGTVGQKINIVDNYSACVFGKGHPKAGRRNQLP